MLDQGLARGVLVVTLDAYRFSTRSRKAANSYLSVARTTFLGLSGAGRTGRWDRPCDVQTEDGLRVRQIFVRRPLMRPRLHSHVRNLLLCYLPAMLRMAKAILSTPADVVHITGTPLAILGLIHNVRYKSTLVLDIQERPGLVSSKGSLTRYFSKLEGLILRKAAKRVSLATVVTHGDVGVVSGLGYRSVELVRNAPLKQWRADYRAPTRSADQGLRFVAIGSIFEGRGYEALLGGFAIASTKHPIELTICGPGRPDYLQSLKALALRLDVANLVNWVDPVASKQVSELYLENHIGLVLYDQADPGNDGLSNKILECVSSGRPVLAGDLSENRRFIVEHSVGWLTDVTESAIANAMIVSAVGEDIGLISERCREYGDTWLNWQSEFGKVLSFVTVHSRQPSTTSPSK